jgi:hypothetical protein
MTAAVARAAVFKTVRRLACERIEAVLPDVDVSLLLALSHSYLREGYTQIE